MYRRSSVHLSVVLAAFSAAACSDTTRPAEFTLEVTADNPTPPGPEFVGTPPEYTSAWGAKEICSRVFMAGEDPEITMDVEISLSGLLSAGFDIDTADIEIDQDRGIVTVDHPGVPARSAVYTGSQGCVIVPSYSGELLFEPVDIPWNGPGSDDAWPLGEELTEGESDIDRSALSQAVDVHMARGQIRAVVVVHRGELVAEQYASGFGPFTPQRAWSTTKSLTATLVGRMVDRGYLQLDEPVPVAAWANDDRNAITLRHLLNMSSGLDQDRLGESETFVPENEHSFIYFEAFDTLADAVEVPFGEPPNTSFLYRNVNPLVASGLARAAAVANGEEGLAIYAREVLEPLGMRSSTVETDAHGNFVASGQLVTTARDLARLGLLHLQGGMFGGERVVSEEWVSFVTSPAPTYEGYGGLWWLNLDGRFEHAPSDAYMALGAFGQIAMVIPSRDLVVTQLAFLPFNENAAFDLLIQDVLAVLDAGV